MNCARPGRSTAASALWLATFAITACGEEPPSAASGSLPSLDEVPVWQVEEVQRIGSVEDPDVGFSGVGELFRDPAGRLHVVETQEVAIRVYSADGELLRRIGRQGEGPGEFLAAPTAVGVHGDTVWAFDQRNRRLTLFRSSGEVLSARTVERVQVPDHSPGWTSEIWPLSMDSEGLFIGGRGMQRDSGEGGEWSDTVRVPRIRFDGSGSVVDTAGGHDLVQTRRLPRLVDVGSSRYVVPAPPSTAPWLIALPNQILFVERGLPGAPLTARISRISPFGDTLSTRAFSFEPTPITPAMREEAVSRSVRGVGLSTLRTDDGVLIFERSAADSAAARRELRRQMDWPSDQPPFRGFRLTAEGILWLDRGVTGGGLRRWSILDAEDRPSGELGLPESLGLRWVAGDTIWAVERDDLDIPWVVRLEIRR